MKLIELCAIGLMLASGALQAEAVLAEAKTLPDGVISLFENDDGSGDSCSIDFLTGKYELSSTSNCKNDQYSYFRLDAVPSATQIKLYSEGDCSKRPDWSFTMHTYIHPTTTKILSIADLNNREAGAIVDRGLILDRKFYDHGSIEGKLSCVMICRSGDTCNWPAW